MLGALFETFVLICILQSDARSEHTPMDCLVYNFENSTDRLEYNFSHFDFQLDEYVGLKPERWQIQHLSEDTEKASFYTGSVGIMPHLSLSPHIFSYGFSKRKIRVINGGIFQFNLYKRSKKSLPTGQVAYIKVILYDPLTRTLENLTMIIDELKEGWSHPVLRLHSSKEFISHIHLFGNASKFLFFYIDAIRYYSYASKKAECPFYSSSKGESLYAAETTTENINFSVEATQKSILANSSLDTITQYNRRFKENFMSHATTSVAVETALSVYDKATKGLSKDKRKNLVFLSSTALPGITIYCDVNKRSLDENLRKIKKAKLKVPTTTTIENMHQTRDKELKEGITFANRNIVSVNESFRPFFQFNNINMNPSKLKKITFLDFTIDTKISKHKNINAMINANDNKSDNNNNNNNMNNNNNNNANANANDVQSRNKNNNTARSKNTVDVKNESKGNITLILIISGSVIAVLLIIIAGILVAVCTNKD